MERGSEKDGRTDGRYTGGAAQNKCRGSERVEV